MLMIVVDVNVVMMYKQEDINVLYIYQSASYVNNINMCRNV